MAPEYLEVLQEIDRGEQEVSEWEAAFLDKLLREKPATLSQKQRAVIEQMAEKYLGRIFQ